MTEPEEFRSDAIKVADAEPSDDSLLREFCWGSEEAARLLYQRYADRLRALARAQTGADMARLLDADDIVQSVFRSFFRGARQGCYQVAAGEDLWGLLLVIALNKVRSQGAYHHAAKRDVRLQVGGEAIRQAGEGACQDPVASPFLQAVVADVLEQLPPTHRRVVALRVEGYEVAEIAQQTGRSKRTVERILQEARERLRSLLEEK